MSGYLGGRSCPTPWLPPVHTFGGLRRAHRQLFHTESQNTQGPYHSGPGLFCVLSQRPSGDYVSLVVARGLCPTLTLAREVAPRRCFGLLIPRLAQCQGAQASFVALLQLPSEWGMPCSPRLCPRTLLCPLQYTGCFNRPGSALLAGTAAVTLLFNQPVSSGEGDQCVS